MIFMDDINLLKLVLVEKRKTGKWLADQLGKSTCTVSKWCQNTTQPDLLTLEQIAQLLEVDIRDLLVGTKLTTTSKY
jgi:transcriptional regulator with XRE-family HTH domain